MTRNGYEAAARMRKAFRLLSAIDEAAGWRVLPKQVAALKSDDWTNAALIAGCRPPSAETQKLVQRLAAERAAAVVVGGAS